MAFKWGILFWMLSGDMTRTLPLITGDCINMYVTMLKSFVGNHDLDSAFAAFFDVLKGLDGVFKRVSMRN